MKIKIVQLILIYLVGIACLAAQVKHPSRDSKEWNDLTVAQRWQAVNIPEDQLTKMTTNDLIEHCINFDFMWDIFNYQDYSSGLNAIIKNHNGVSNWSSWKDITYKNYNLWLYGKKLKCLHMAGGSMNKINYDMFSDKIATLIKEITNEI